MKNIRFTKEGFENLKKEFAQLKEERPAAVADLKKARDMGDLSENGYYKAARQKLSSIDYRMRTITYELKEATFIEERTVVLDNDGQTVTYKIVGDLEANPKEGKISNKSPIGAALEGKKTGDVIQVITPSHTTTYRIVEIKN